jgi:hypothetical protein
MSSDNLDTKPTIETVLERINELGARLETRMGSLETRIVGLETAVTDMRDEMRQGFHELERRVDTVSIDMNKLRSDLRFMDDRLSRLEKAS